MGAGLQRGRAGAKGWEGGTRANRERRKAGEREEKWEGKEGEEAHRKAEREGGREERRVGGKRGTQRHREFCNNLNSFQTMSKEPWQHGLKQTLPLIL